LSASTALVDARTARRSVGRHSKVVSTVQTISFSASHRACRHVKSPVLHFSRFGRTHLRPSIDATVDEARANGLHVHRVSGYGKTLDSRLLLIQGKLCQIVRSRQIANPDYPNAMNVPLYLPRTQLADFLIYAACTNIHEDFSFYIVPRGLMTKDTAWSLSTMEQFHNCWDSLRKTSTPGITERRFTVLNWQLQTIIKAAEEASLEVTLLKRKNLRPWPIYAQRRILVATRRCAVYSCSRLSPDPNQQRYDYIFLRRPKANWAEFQLCIVRDGPASFTTYVIPIGVIPQKTTASLDNSCLQFYKNNWKLLVACDLSPGTPINWRPLKPIEKPKPLPVTVLRTMLQAEKYGLSVQSVSARKPGIDLSTKCLYIANKPCQIMMAKPKIIGARSFIPLNVPKTNWAEFLVVVVVYDTKDELTFYVVPRTKLCKRTMVSPASSWIRDYKEAWHLLSQ
jgi:hypothetical protein